MACMTMPSLPSFVRTRISAFEVETSVPTAFLQFAASSAVDMLISLLLVGRLVLHRRSIRAHAGSASGFGSVVHERTRSWTRTLLRASLATATATTIVQTCGLIFIAIDPCAQPRPPGANGAQLPLERLGCVLRDAARSLCVGPGDQG